MRWMMVFVWFVALAVVADDVVENSAAPSGKAKTLRFTEEVRFGADEDDDNYLWPAMTTMVVMDNDLNMYLVDPSESRCLKFDANGQFVERVIRKGEGPGEITNLLNMMVTEDGQFVALGSGIGGMPGFHFYDADFQIQDVKSPSGFNNMPQNVNFGPHGKHMAGVFTSFDMSEGTMLVKNGVIKANFNMLKEMTKFSVKMDMQGMRQISVLRDFFATMIRKTQENQVAVAFDAQGNVYTAQTGQYEITKWNPDMSQVLMTIRRKYKPIPNPEENKQAIFEHTMRLIPGFPNSSELLSDENMARMLELADLPLVKKPIHGMLVMEDGHLLVVHDMNLISGEQTVDIFSPAGQYIGQKTMGQWAFIGLNGVARMRFQHGKASTILTDEYGDNRAVRYDVSLVSQ